MTELTPEQLNVAQSASSETEGTAGNKKSLHVVRTVKDFEDGLLTEEEVKTFCKKYLFKQEQNRRHSKERSAIKRPKKLAEERLKKLLAKQEKLRQDTMDAKRELINLVKQDKGRSRKNNKHVFPEDTEIEDSDEDSIEQMLNELETDDAEENKENVQPASQNIKQD